MLFWQKVVLNLVPKSWAEDIQQESLAWRAQYPNCGYETSIWEAGGVRWRGKGNPRMLLKCKNCQNIGWHQFSKSS